MARFDAVAEAFVAEHGRDRSELWREKTRDLRARIAPNFFRHSERLRNGGEPLTTAIFKRTKTHKEWDQERLQRRTVERIGGAAVFATMNFSVKDNQVGDNLGPRDEIKVENGWKTGAGPDGEFCIEPPDQRTAGVDYEPVDRNTAERMVNDDYFDYTQDSKKKVQDDADLFPSQEAPVRTRCQDLWTADQTGRLLALVLDQNLHNWDRISSRVKHDPIECQEKYRELADLPLHDRSLRAWNQKDDTDLLRFRGDYNVRDWVRISHHLQRTVGACQERYDQLTGGPAPKKAKTAPKKTTADREIANQETAVTEQDEAKPHRYPTTRAKRQREDEQPQAQPRKKRRAGTTKSSTKKGTRQTQSKKPAASRKR